MRKKSLIAVGMSAMLLLTAIGGVMATAPSLDTETTDTAGTTELDGTSTQAYNTSTTSFLNTSQDSNQTTAEIRQGADGRLLDTHELNSSDNLNYETVVSGTYYHRLELADDGSDYPGLEADAGEDVTIEVRSINTADDPETMTNTTFTFSNDANVSFVHMNNSETMVADSTGAGIRASVFSIGGNDSDAGAAEVTQEGIGVNGDSQDSVIVNIGNADAQDSTAAVYDATEETEAFSTVGVASFSGETIPVFAAGQDTPSWFDEDMTYATVSEDGSTVKVVNAGESLSEDDTEADFSMEANDAIGFNNARNLASDYGASAFDSLSVGIDALNLNGQPELTEV
ncbi:hypothetical protein [Haloarcula sp. Atlit-120R]|uniref:hypothetical protein n=1 Tax=Haloarcula sp. Atlit-120R TaxID=2282135 RepID=UPI000EF28B3C|nr:hypothetical protein [Haloarcula sp. Atlit-120R]RLM32616.1 hypothetical protein DVK01_20295 [Haloarcula sp. Atlit-120R]